MGTWKDNIHASMCLVGFPSFMFGTRGFSEGFLRLMFTDHQQRSGSNVSTQWAPSRELVTSHDPMKPCPLRYTPFPGSSRHPSPGQQMHQEGVVPMSSLVWRHISSIASKYTTPYTAAPKALSSRLLAPPGRTRGGGASKRTDDSPIFVAGLPRPF